MVAIIPARMGSTRLPGKALLAETGRALIAHVHDAVVSSGVASRVVVATDDERIAGVIRAAGGEAVMTGAWHANGTSRLGEAASALGVGEDAVIVNVQGDEPEIEGAIIEAAVGALVDDPGADVGTVGVEVGAGEAAAWDEHVVKVVCGASGRALYFSRSRVPSAGAVVRHVGIYAYRRAFLEWYAGTSASALERAERLEQLRALEHGKVIAVRVVGGVGVSGGIDTRGQYDAFVARWRGRGGG